MMMTMVQNWDTEPNFANMSKSDILRGLITEKLSTVAQEILAVVERTVADYEEEAAGFRQEIDRQRRLLELLQPEIKQEADDQQLFSFCEAGGGPLLDDQEQKQYELRVEDHRSLLFQALMEEEEYENLDEEEGHTTELDCARASRFLTQTVPSKKRKRHGRDQSSNSENHINLKIRILENRKIEVVSNLVFMKYPLHELKVPRGLQEADFLKLLRSTFPQLAGDEPFDFFLQVNKNKTLRPLKVDSVTPEEIKRVCGGATLYIQLSVSRDDIRLKIRILENRKIEVLSNPVFWKYPLHKLKVPRGLQEADFLKLLRSTFPQLAGDEPFDLFLSCNRTRLKPLQVDSVTPEEIDRVSLGNTLYIRLQKEDADEDPPSTLDSVGQNPRTTSDKTPTETDTHINLKIRILENREIEVLSNLVFMKYPLYELKVPRGLQEADFLKLLRSTFPQLAGDERFDFFLQVYMNKTLRPLKVRSVTPEEIKRVSGGKTLYIQLSVSRDDLRLKIRILENRKIEVLSKTVFWKYPLHKLKVPRGLQEADFLKLLRSTFPQLAGDEPFDLLLLGNCTRLKPLKVDSVTPEEISRVTRGASLYIRLQKEDADEDPPSTLDSVGQNPRTTSDKTPTETDTHINLKIRILENRKIDVLSHTVFWKYPLHELKVPRGLQEADFLKLLRSTFPQLAGDEPFTILIRHHNKLTPPRVESMTAEEICRNRIQNPDIYIRLEDPEKRSPQKDDATVAAELPPPRPDPTTLSTEVESEKAQISQSDTRIHLKIHIVEDPQMDTISPNLFQNYPPHELQVPRGLQDADFLNLLRSTFPQLTAAAPLEFLICNDDEILEPLNVESLTTEEIKEAVKSTGNATLFVRRKASEDVQDDVNKLNGAEDSPSFSE